MKTDKGLTVLLKECPDLQCVYIDDTNITEEGLADLRKVYPNII